MWSTDETYRINEIFYSLQSEGYFTGTPAVFIRFSGCNRACPFCDTDHSAYTTMTTDEIMAEVRRFNSHHIVVTGGEPLLQLSTPLLLALKADGYFIAVETNGSLPVPPMVDWVTCSPKEEPWNIDRVDELKIVYQGQDVEAIAERFNAPHLFLQPCSGLNTAETIDYIMAHPHWRLSLQTHKILNIQ